MNKYVPGTIPGVDPRTARLIQQLYERTNQLSDELDSVRGGMAKQVSAKANKEAPVPGIVNLPDGGFIRVSPHGVIVSYTNSVSDQFPYIDVSVVGNVGAGTDDLHSYTLPARTLAQTGDYLEVWYGGNFATTGSTKQIFASFGGTVYEDTSTFDLNVAVGWVIQARITRMSSSSVLVSNKYAANLVSADSANAVQTFGAGGAFIGRSTTISGLSSLDTSDTELLVQGSATADNDIVQNLSIIDYRTPRTRKLA